MGTMLDHRRWGARGRALWHGAMQQQAAFALAATASANHAGWLLVALRVRLLATGWGAWPQRVTRVDWTWCATKAGSSGQLVAANMHLFAHSEPKGQPTTCVPHKAACVGTAPKSLGDGKVRVRYDGARALPAGSIASMAAANIAVGMRSLLAEGAAYDDMLATPSIADGLVAVGIAEQPANSKAALAALDAIANASSKGKAAGKQPAGKGKAAAKRAQRSAQRSGKQPA